MQLRLLKRLGRSFLGAPFPAIFDNTQSEIAAENGGPVSRVDGRSWSIGQFEMVSLAKLRAYAARTRLRSGKPRVSLVHGDIHRMRANHKSRGGARD